MAGGLLAGCRRPVARTAAPLAVTPPVSAPVAPPSVVSPLAAFRPSPRLFEQAAHAPHQVALTFDAGADDSAVRSILAQLLAHHVRATFFLTGRFCELYPDSCRAIANAGMEIGNHSYSHPHFTKRTDAQIRTQLEHADQVIARTCGCSTRPLFRFPYGDCNRRTRSIVAREGYQAFGWSLDSLDSVGKPKSADFVAKRIIAKIKPGYITLMHVSYPHSAQALPRIFAYLDKRGLKAVPISQLLLAQTAAENDEKMNRKEPRKCFTAEDADETDKRRCFKTS